MANIINTLIGRTQANMRIDDAVEYKNDKVATERLRQRVSDSSTAASQDIASLRTRLENDVEKVLTSVREEPNSIGLKKEAMEHLYKAFSINNVSVRFEMSGGMNSELVLKLVDKTSGETVWQMPPERALELKELAKLFPGVMLDRII